MYIVAVLSKSVSILLPVTFVLIRYIDNVVYLNLRSLHPQMFLCSEHQYPNQSCSRTGSTKTDSIYISIAHISHQIYMLVMHLMDYAIVGLVLVGITYFANIEGMQLETDTIFLDPIQRCVKLCVLICWVIKKFCWPSELRPHYQIHEYEIDILSNPECLFSVLIVILGMLVATLGFIGTINLSNVLGNINTKCHNRIQPRLQFHSILSSIIVYFLVMILPPSGLLQHGMVTKAADRYAYFPSIVLVPAMGYALGTMLILISPQQSKKEHMKHNDNMEKGPAYQYYNLITRILFYFTILLTIVSFSYVSRCQMEHWRTEESLYLYSIRYCHSIRQSNNLIIKC